MTYCKQHTLVSILIGMSASIFWCFQCTQANVTTHKPEEVKVSLSDSEKSDADTLQESFDAFLYHFSTDSLFQIAHIRFPLQGIVVDDISGEEKKIWHVEDWTMHGLLELDSNWNRVLTVKENVVNERIELKNSGFWTERKFRRDKGKWYLTYFEIHDL